jgi:hypothetical protein
MSPSEGGGTVNPGWLGAALGWLASKSDDSKLVAPGSLGMTSDGGLWGLACGDGTLEPDSDPFEAEAADCGMNPPHWSPI